MDTPDTMAEPAPTTDGAPATVEITQAVAQKMLSLVQKLLSVTNERQAEKLVKRISETGAVFADGCITIPVDAFFGCNVSDERVTYRVVQPATTATAAADANAAADSDASTSGTPLTRARGVFQSRPVAEMLIAGAGSELGKLNQALNDALLENELVNLGSNSKRARAELHEMPGPTEPEAKARKMVSSVAQQVLGAVWTLARATAGPGTGPQIDTAMQTHAETLKSNAQAVFSLPGSEAILSQYIDTSPAALSTLRACHTCRSLRCKDCRTESVTPSSSPAAVVTDADMESDTETEMDTDTESDTESDTPDEADDTL